MEEKFPGLAEKRGMESSCNLEDRQKLLRMSEISLWLDSYDDIFSDFDSRQYAQKALSHDFLDELRRAARDKASGAIELKLLILAKKKNIYHETVIKKRLRDHFKKHLELLGNEKKQTLKQGICFTVAGVITMFIASLVLFKYGHETLLKNFLVILLEPAGWFLFWEGLNLAIFESKKEKPELEFYRKMAGCEISFLPY